MEFTTPGGLVFDPKYFGVDDKRVTAKLMGEIDDAYAAGLAVQALFGTTINPTSISNVKFEDTGGGLSVSFALEDPYLPTARKKGDNNE